MPSWTSRWKVMVVMREEHVDFARLQCREPLRGSQRRETDFGGIS